MSRAGTQVLGSGTRRRLVERTPFFYGWVILLAGSFGTIMSSPGQTYTIAIFIEQFIADLGVSRGTVSAFYLVGTLAASFGLPFVGKQIDLRGPRLMVGVIAVALGLTCFYVGLIQTGGMLLIGFVLLRFFGQGSMSLVSTYVINQWWVRRRGAILGISGVLVAAFGVAAFPNLVNWLIPQFGWRYTYAFLGVVLIFVMAPIGVMFFRSHPERTMMGLMRTVSTVVWPTYFGRLHLGAIAGFATTLSVAASALDPMPMGIARDVFGSYNLTLTVLSILPLTLAVVSLFVRTPQRESAAEPPQS